MRLFIVPAAELDIIDINKQGDVRRRKQRVGARRILSPSYNSKSEKEYTQRWLKGRIQYLVEWMDWPDPKDFTWEPPQHLHPGQIQMFQKGEMSEPLDNGHLDGDPSKEGKNLETKEKQHQSCRKESLEGHQATEEDRQFKQFRSFESVREKGKLEQASSLHRSEKERKLSTDGCDFNQNIIDSSSEGKRNQKRKKKELKFNKRQENGIGVKEVKQPKYQEKSMLNLLREFDQSMTSEKLNQFIKRNLDFLSDGNETIYNDKLKKPPPSKSSKPEPPKPSIMRFANITTYSANISPSILAESDLQKLGGQNPRDIQNPPINKNQSKNQNPLQKALIVENQFFQKCLKRIMRHRKSKERLLYEVDISYSDGSVFSETWTSSKFFSENKEYELVDYLQQHILDYQFTV